MGPEQLEAVRKLKDALVNPPVLHIFRQEANLEIHTDASSLGFGAVLMQQSSEGKWNPLYYMSRKTTLQQEKYSSYELEMLAIVEALKKFRNYVLGTKFKIVTDCDAFKRTLHKKELAPKVARWALFLEEFDFEVVHRPGRQMPHVDALSRNALMITTRSQSEVTMKIAAAQNEDEHLKMIKTMVEQGEKNDHFLRNDVLYKYVDGRELLVIPSAMCAEIIQSIHNQGHFAVAKTEEAVKQSYYIPNARKRIENVIVNCVKCILCNRKKGKGEGLLNPIPKEDTPLSTYHVDHIGPLASTNKNYQHILTVIDAFTKFTWCYPCKTTSTKEAIDKLKAQQAVFGNPGRIISDRGSAFNSQDFTNYCNEQGIEHVQITTGIPRGNGQVERIHNVIIPVLAKMSIEDPTKWYRHVPDVQRVINSTVARSTKITPFELLIGIKMKNNEDQHILNILKDEFTTQVMMDRDKLRSEAKTNILAMQQENCRQYNKKRKKARMYKINDLVAIQRTQFGSGLKLKPKYFGPYCVTRVKFNNRYDVAKVGEHDGPNATSSAADHMKPWSAGLAQ